LNETPDTNEKKSKINDSNVAYFDCKNCEKTFTINSDQENFDPNVPTDISKNCLAKQLFQSVLSEEALEESSRRSKSIRSPHPSAAVADFDATSPLTSNLGDVGSGSSSSSSSSISREPQTLPKHLTYIE
jgi:hypothetical protein